jgi:hypothetical protein
MLWIELRFAMVEEPIALRLAFPGSATDPESHENRILIRNLQRLDLEIAHPLAWVVVAVEQSGLLDEIIRGSIAEHIDIDVIARAINRTEQKADPGEVTRFGLLASVGWETNSLECIESLIDSSSRRLR